jgi:hypothetical protein
MSAAPDLVGPVHPQPAEQIGVGLVPLRGPAGVGRLVDRHQAHQPPDAFLDHGMAFVLQVPGHLPQAALLQKGGVTRDSRRESSMIAVLHEQADTPDVQDHELAELQRGAQAPRVADDLV